MKTKNATDSAARPAAATKLMGIFDPAAPLADGFAEPSARQWTAKILPK
jgi:hypothetical protein